MKPFFTFTREVSVAFRPCLGTNLRLKAYIEGEGLDSASESIFWGHCSRWDHQMITQDPILWSKDFKTSLKQSLPHLVRIEVQMGSRFRWQV